MGNKPQNMRDVLKYVVDMLDHYGYDHADVVKAVTMCKEALLTPKINCDNLRSYDDFVNAWNTYVEKSHNAGVGAVIGGFLYWLTTTVENTVSE